MTIVTIKDVDADIKALFQLLLECQTRTEKSVSDLAAMVARLVDTQVRTEQSIADLALNVDKYVTAADAIASEHLNGKGHP